jgi:hypothetical protein
MKVNGPASGAAAGRPTSCLVKAGSRATASAPDSSLRQHREGLGSSPLACLLARGVVDPTHELLAMRLVKPENLRSPDRAVHATELYGRPGCGASESLGRPVHARPMMRSGPYTLWTIPRIGYVQTGQLISHIAADRTDIGPQTTPLLRSDLADTGGLPKRPVRGPQRRKRSSASDARPLRHRHDPQPARIPHTGLRLRDAAHAPPRNRRAQRLL